MDDRTTVTHGIVYVTSSYVSTAAWSSSLEAMDVVRFDDGVEDGEIGSVDDYDPALEYPGDNQVSEYAPQARVSSPSSPAASATNKTSTFRLIALNSTVLSRSRRIAVLDGHAEVSIGRDVTTSARVRLKELAVSKFHASIYWDGSRREWGIVDMGSVHGTFVRSAQDHSTLTPGNQPKLGTRLSDPRKASMPKVLRHLDEITIGGTTFLVHEHLNGRPCPDCAIDGQIDIPLFSHASTGSSTSSHNEHPRKRKLPSDNEERDAKKAMAKLKSSLMSRHVPLHTSSSVPNAAYKDRSALRRELHPESRVPSRPVSIPPESQPGPIPTLRPASPSPPPLPPPPVSSNNIGHKLLLLQGWSPGTALGENPDIGLIEPLNLSANAPRAGLGAPIQSGPLLPHPSRDWKEEAKRRRWDDVKRS